MTTPCTAGPSYNGIHQLTSYQLTVAESTFKFANASESLEVDQYRTITVASALGTPTYSIEGSTATINTSTGKVTGTAAGAAVTVTASRDAGGTTTDGYLAKTATYQLTVAANSFASTLTTVQAFTHTNVASTCSGGGDGAITWSISSAGGSDTAYKRVSDGHLGSGVGATGTSPLKLSITRAKSGNTSDGWLARSISVDVAITMPANSIISLAQRSDNKIYLTGTKCAFPRNSDHWLRWNLRP